MLALIRKRTGLYPLARGTFRIGAILHGVAIIDLGMAVGHIPVDNFFQTLSLCAFLIAVLRISDRGTVSRGRMALSFCLNRRRAFSSCLRDDPGGSNGAARSDSYQRS
jgi:hypothetical protein